MQLLRTILKSLIGGVLALAVLAGGYLLFAYHFTYSRGESVGFVQKISYKGWLCKTWEGEILLSSMPGAIPERFAFLVPEKSYPVWVQDSKTRPLLEATGNSLQALLPDNLDQSLGKMLKRDSRPANDEPPAETEEKPTTTPSARPQQRGQTQTRPDNSPQIGRAHV